MQDRSDLGTWILEWDSCVGSKCRFGFNKSAINFIGNFEICRLYAKEIWLVVLLLMCFYYIFCLE